MSKTLWTNARIASCAASETGLGIIEDGAIFTSDGRIDYIGSAREIPPDLAASAERRTDLQGRWITPGLIDCHTHLIFGGDRSREFELRLAGASYAELQQAGGGIFGTVNATRSATDKELSDAADTRLKSMLRLGATTVEIKSGYGLTPKHELRMLRIARGLSRKEDLPAVISTCLAAHALPKEYEHDRAAYLQLIIEGLLPVVAAEKLAKTVDAFGEHIAFTQEEIRQLFSAARELGFSVKLHADQLSDQNGAAIAAEFSALSADHLEYTSKAGVSAMAKAGTVAVMLPIAYYTLKETQLPPIQLFREAGVRMAVATDANPGSAPSMSLPLAMNMACILFGMTVEEALLGVTRHAAAALNLSDRGYLAKGMRADFCVWSVERLAEIIYWTGYNTIANVVIGGSEVYSDTDSGLL